MAPIEGVDSKSLASSGWGVIFAPDIGPDVREALKPLLELRKRLAGDYFKEYTYTQGQAKSGFLAREKAGPGPVDPKKVPYYLLLVGDPRSIPFHFQYELDVQFAVGRIHFDSAEEYANYARSVVAAETGQGALPGKTLTLFGVSNQDDPATQSVLRNLVIPLGDALRSGCGDWSVKVVREQEATKDRLGHFLGGGETPALLFTGSHGMAFPVDDSRQISCQGALLCQDWPGPKQWQQAIPSDFYFSSDDVGRKSLLGMIAFHFACHSAGSPDLSDFGDDTLSDPEQIAPYPFLSRLSRRLLSQPAGGALAVLGHIDRAWTTSFSWTPDDSPQIEVFESTIKRLLTGSPVGSAMECVNQRYAELSVELTGLLIDRDRMVSISRSLTSRVLRAQLDARNFIVIGDPAVRLISSSPVLLPDDGVTTLRMPSDETYQREMPREEAFNGIDGSTGRYLSWPMESKSWELGRPLDPARLREYRWWVERYGIDDPDR
jgi:hypothetical protein